MSDFIDFEVVSSDDDALAVIRVTPDASAGVGAASLKDESCDSRTKAEWAGSALNVFVTSSSH